MKWIIDRKELAWFCVLAVIISKLILFWPPKSPYTYISQLFLYASLGCCVCILFWIPKLRISWFEGCLLSYGVLVSLVTALHDYTQVLAWLFLVVVLFTLTQILHYAITISKVDILKVLARVFSFYFYINFILLLLYPDGLWRREDGLSWYLFGGNYNGMGIVLLMAMLTNMLYCVSKRHIDWNTIFILIASPLCMLYLGSMTSTVGLILAALLLVWSDKKICWWGIIGLLCVVVVFNVFVVFFQGDLTWFDLAVYFVEDVLQKDMTFTHRTDIWANAVELVGKAPWFGYGLHDLAWHREQLGFENASTPHNLLLAVLMIGGICLLAVFVLCLLLAFIRSVKVNNRAARVAQVGVVVALLLSLTEALSVTYIFYCMMLMNYAGDLSHRRLPVGTDVKV